MRETTDRINFRAAREVCRMTDGDDCACSVCDSEVGIRWHYVMTECGGCEGRAYCELHFPSVQTLRSD